MSLFVMIIALLVANTDSNAQLITEKKILVTELTRLRHNAVLALGLELDRYRRQTGHYPEKLSEMTETVGFEQDRSYSSISGLDYKFATSATLETRSNYYKYDRALIASIDFTQSTLEDFAASNTCGSGDFSSAAEWCADAKLGNGYKTESRHFYMMEIAQASRRLKNTVEKFVAYKNAHKGQLPDFLSNTPLTSSIVPPIPAQLDSTCSGSFDILGIPLGCEDLFGFWGKPVMYVVDDEKVFLKTTSPLKLSNGSYESVAIQIL